MKRLILLLLIGMSGQMWGAPLVTLEELLTNGTRNGRYLLKDESFTLESIPQSLEEFVALRDEIADNPKGGVAMMIVAMKVYAEDEELGTKLFTIALDRSALIRSVSKPNYKNYIPSTQSMYFIRQIATHPYLAGIYIEGTKAKTAYVLPQKPPYILRFAQATVSDKDEITLYVVTTSGNRPRPVKLKKNNRGIWKAIGFSSLFVGAMKAPKYQVDDDL